MDLGFMLCMMIDIGPKFYSAIPMTTSMALRSKSQTSNVYVKLLH